MFFSRLPGWVQSMIPRVFYVTEKAWNYYPFTITGWFVVLIYSWFNVYTHVQCTCIYSTCVEVHVQFHWGGGAGGHSPPPPPPSCTCSTTVFSHVNCYLHVYVHVVSMCVYMYTICSVYDEVHIHVHVCI